MRPLSVLSGSVAASMPEQEQADNRLPPETVIALIHTALQRQKRGDRAGARALLRALVTQQPDETRAWLALAAVAETRDEQYRALERVLALDPQHPLARRGLTRFQTLSASHAGATNVSDHQPDALPESAFRRVDRESAPPREAPAPAAAPAGAPAEEPESELLTPTERARQIRWPLYVALVVAILIVLAVAVLLQLLPAAARPVPTPSPPAAGQRSPVSNQTAVAGMTPPAHPQPTLPAAGGTTATPPSAALSPVPPTASPGPTPLPALRAGEVVVQGTWHAALLRPGDAVVLDGSIGELQPQGRFVLALVAVGNNTNKPARIPADLFTLVDERGGRYQPLPAASAEYLKVYGRGQRGDLSMDEPVPQGGGNVSVPLIFDVPLTARYLTLRVGNAPAGWPIEAALARAGEVDIPPASPSP